MERLEHQRHHVWGGGGVTTMTLCSVAVLVRPGRLRSRRIEAVLSEVEEIRELMELTSARPPAVADEAGPGREEELIAEVRASRSSR